MTEVLAVEGATLPDVVKTTLYLIDMGEFAAVNEVWVEYFTENRPTRSAVAVAALPVGSPGRGRGLGLRPAGLSRRRRRPVPVRSWRRPAPLRWAAAPGCQATCPKR